MHELSSRIEFEPTVLNPPKLCLNRDVVKAENKFRKYAKTSFK